MWFVIVDLDRIITLPEQATLRIMLLVLQFSHSSYVLDRSKFALMWCIVMLSIVLTSF